VAKDRVECVVIDVAENLVVTAHDGAEDGLGLAFVGKFRRFVAPDQRQPFAWQHQFRPDRNPGEKAVEIGQHHAVRWRAIGHQEAVERLQIDLVENRMRQCLGAHGGLASRAQHHGMRRSRGQAASLRDPHHCQGSNSSIRLAG
jgi:hypothetical protein